MASSSRHSDRNSLLIHCRSERSVSLCLQMLPIPGTALKTTLTAGGEAASRTSGPGTPGPSRTHKRACTHTASTCKLARVCTDMRRHAQRYDSGGQGGNTSRQAAASRRSAETGRAPDRPKICGECLPKQMLTRGCWKANAQGLFRTCGRFCFLSHWSCGGCVGHEHMAPEPESGACSLLSSVLCGARQDHSGSPHQHHQALSRCWFNARCTVAGRS